MPPVDDRQQSASPPPAPRGTSPSGPQRRPFRPAKHGAAVEPVDANLDHVRGPASAPLVLEYGDYECPYSARAYREIERVEARLPDGLRFAFRHFPLTPIHPHALAASAAAEAAALQGRFWGMHDLLFHGQAALEDEDFGRYAAELGLDVERFENDRASDPVLLRVERDVRSGIATGEIRGTPTLFIDGAVHRGAYDAETLLEAIAR
jgi:protein-disulfide isomerase